MARLDRRDRVWAKLQHLPVSRALQRLQAWLAVRRADENRQDEYKRKNDLMMLQRYAVA